GVAAREIAPLGATQAATPFSAAALADAPIAPAQGPSARPSAPDFSFAPRNAGGAAAATGAPARAPEAAKVTCARCGAWNEVGLRFCVTCGGSLEPRTAPVPANAPAPSPIANAAAIPGAIAPARVVSLAAPQAPETVRVCARCRGVCDAAAQFCRFCG